MKGEGASSNEAVSHLGLPDCLASRIMLRGLLLCVVMAFGGCGGQREHDPSAPAVGANDLLMSASEDGTELGSLDGATVSGSIHVVFTDHRKNIREVRFHLNLAPTPIKIDTEAPFDLALDTTELSDGEHTLTALTPLGREGQNTRELARATFMVKNNQASPNPEPSPYDQFAQIHVDANSGLNSNAGSREAPIRTLYEGLRRALANRRMGIDTRVLLYPGTYRESVNEYVGSSGALIVIQAVESGKAVVSGSDVWSDWSCSASLCTHSWPYDWGLSENPWPQVSIEPIGLRRELIFVDGDRLEQKLSHAELVPGSFYIDEVSDTVYMKPPSGVSIANSTVEVAVRPVLLRLQGLNDLVIKGIAFQHAASPLATAAVDIVDQSRVLIEDTVVQHNNWSGLSFKGDDFTLRRSTMNHNGGNGVGALRTRNLLLEDNESSYNNWRGYAGGLTGWSVGQKFLHVHGLVIRRHISENNLARGLWLDSDIRDATLEDLRLCNNLNNGIFIELVPGPITLKNSTICDNQAPGILTSASRNLTFEGNTIRGNKLSQIRLSGNSNVSVVDFVTGETYVLNNENWLWRSNTVTATDNNQVIISTTFPRE